MAIQKHLRIIKISLALVVSLFSTGILPTSYAYAAKPETPPGRQATVAPSGPPARQESSGPVHTGPQRSSHAQPQSPRDSQSEQTFPSAGYESSPATTHNSKPAAQKHPHQAKSSKPASSQTHKAITPGNNGTIKVTEVGDPNDSPPNNDPHVSCSFDTEFYRFDANAITTVDFSPDVGPQGTPDSATIKTGQKSFQLDNDGVTGGTAFDGEETYELNLIGSPHPKQGYHLKVTALTTQSLGSMKKSKVFWLTCPTATTVTPPQTPPKQDSSPLSQGMVLGVSNFIKAMMTPATIPTSRVLGVKAATTPLALPARIPATGVGDLGNPLYILLASLLTYGAVYLAQGRKRFNEAKTSP